MKPEKFYTVGRSTARRAVRRAIIDPKPEPPTAPAPVAQPPANSAAVRNVWPRLWSIAKATGRATIAVAVAVIAFLTYENQHQVDEIAAIATQRHQAALVSFIFQQGNGQSNETALIDNSSDNPVNDVQLASKVTFTDGHSYSLHINLGAMPPCSVGRITSSMIADYLRAAMFAYMQNKDIRFEKIDGNYQFSEASMYFIDNNGIAWRYPEGGPVENTANYASSPGSIPGSAGTPVVWSGSAGSLVVMYGSAWSAVIWPGPASSAVVWPGSASSPGVISSSASSLAAFLYYASPSGAFYAQESPSNLIENSSWTNSSDNAVTLELMPAPSFPFPSYAQAGGCS
jgi:hypothetical protein